MKLNLKVPAWVSLSLAKFEADFSLDTYPEVLPVELYRTSDKRKRDFLAGRHAARQALLLAGCADAGPLKMGADRLPLWPTGWKGSISHSDGVAIAAVAPSTFCVALGIDIERIIGQGIVAEIQTEIGRAEEYEFLHDFDARTGTTLLFSAKEAVYKALYPNVKKFVGFDGARLDCVAATELAFVLTQSWGEDWCEGANVRVHYDLLDDYVCTAVCVSL